ncbi:MAG: ATP-binding protein [Candidatus Eiseniibacteriota bacterium]
MRSLRSRVIVGCTLVALVPLAIAMFFLSNRVESTVRAEAEGRLGAALDELSLQVSTDAKQIEGKLQILARDPVLKRLYLLQPSGSRDLNDYLAERQYLLGLDFLEVADLQSVVVGSGTETPTIPRPLAISSNATILYEQKVAGSVAGGRLIDSAFLDRLKQSAGLDLVLRDSTGTVIAATIDSSTAHSVPASSGRAHLASGAYVVRGVPLQFDNSKLVNVTGLISTAAADQTIETLRWTSLLLGVLGLGIAILLGTLWSSQISRPVERLAAYSRKLAKGEWDDPVDEAGVAELSVLAEALDQMRQDLTTYRDKLVRSERHAAWSEMAKKVAHEVKNPLTPIAVSVADLKRSYELQRPDFPAILDQAVRTVREEVDSLRKMLQEFSDFARLPSPSLTPSSVAGILSDVEALYRHEADAGRFQAAIPSPDITATIDSAQIRQALVNLVKNGFEAMPSSGKVTLTAKRDNSLLDITVADTGPGLTAEQKSRLFTPGFTTKAQGSGLGLTIVERIANDHGGTVSVESATGSGTTIHLRLPLRPDTAGAGRPDTAGAGRPGAAKA